MDGSRAGEMTPFRDLDIFGTHPKRMRRVIIESPYKGPPEKVAEHEAYADECMLDSLRRGESPFLSHLLYTRVLNDADPIERSHGLNAAKAWYHVVHAVVVYRDLGISEGMSDGIKYAVFHGKPIEYRRIRE